MPRIQDLDLALSAIGRPGGRNETPTTTRRHDAGGIKVEVKSAAYIQSWHQQKSSQISCGISRTTAWDAEANTWGNERKRQADVHVFALLDCQDQSRGDLFDLALWR